MIINDFITSFAEQFEELNENELKLDTKFRELDEWSSLIALSVIAMVDEEYNITLKGDDLRKAETISDLFEILKSKI